MWVHVEFLVWRKLCSQWADKILKCVGKQAFQSWAHFNKCRGILLQMSNFPKFWIKKNICKCQAELFRENVPANLFCQQGGGGVVINLLKEHASTSFCCIKLPKDFLSLTFLFLLSHKISFNFLAPQLVHGGNIDFLVFDYLSEITMSLLARAQQKSPVCIKFY